MDEMNRDNMDSMDREPVIVHTNKKGAPFLKPIIIDEDGELIFTDINLHRTKNGKIRTEK